MNPRRKGNKAEREGLDIYGAAGFKAERVTATRGGRSMSDTFGQFDIIAVDPDRPLRLAQVKSNTAGGIREFVRWCEAFLPTNHARGDFLIRHDGRGGKPVTWRLQRPHVDGDRVTYRTVVDERKDGTPTGGEGVAEWIRGHD